MIEYIIEGYFQCVQFRKESIKNIEMVMKNMNTRLTIDRKKFWGKTAVILLLLSAVLRGVAAILARAMLKGDLFATVEFILPAVACLLYVLTIVLFGKKGFILSAVPFIAGVLGFIMRLFSYDNLLQEPWPLRHAFLSVLVYLVVLSVYSATVSGGLRTKWILAPLFLLVLLYHTVMEVYPVFASRAHVELSGIFAEASIYALLLGLLAGSVGLSRKRKDEKPDDSSAAGPSSADAAEKEEKNAPAQKTEEPEVIVVEDVPELAEEDEPDAGSATEAEAGSENGSETEPSAPADGSQTVESTKE